MPLTPFSPSKATTNGKSKQRILYVEDEDMNWEVTEFALRDRYDIDRAKTSGEVFAKLRRHIYHVILMDIQLSGSQLNGIDITRVLRGCYDKKKPEELGDIEVPYKAPIVFVTAYQARYKKADLTNPKIGGDDLIFKPVDFTKLSLVMSRLLVRGAMEQLR